MSRILGLLVLLSLAPTNSTLAQATPQIHLRDRIRVSAAECGLLQQTGIVISLETDVFTLAVNEEEVHCPTIAAEKIELSLGERHWRKASLIGLGVGAMVGGVTIGVAGGRECEPGATECPPAEWFAAGAMVGGLSGLTVGTLVGMARGSEGWQKVPIPFVQSSMQLSHQGAPRFFVSFRR